MAEQKSPWTWAKGVSSGERRKQLALEHIAHYLDLIEGHLAIIAKSLSEGGSKDVGERERR